MEKHNRIYIAGNRGLVGSAIHRGLEQRGYSNLLVRPHAQLDLTDRVEVRAFFEQEKPEFVFLAAAKVGGILANETYPADFIRENLEIQTNLIDAGELLSFCDEEAAEAVDRRAVGVDRAVVSVATAKEGQPGPSVGREPGVFRGHSVDSVNRRGVAILAGRVSFALDLLASAQAVGGRRGLAGCVAHAAGGTG